MILSAQELCEKDPDMFWDKNLLHSETVGTKYTFLEMSRSSSKLQYLKTAKYHSKESRFSVYENPLGNGKVGLLNNWFNYITSCRDLTTSRAGAAFTGIFRKLCERQYIWENQST